MWQLGDNDLNKLTISVFSLIKKYLLALIKYIKKDSKDSDTISFAYIAKELSAFVVIIALIFLIANFIVGLISCSFSNYIVIEQFEVPAYLASNGFTGKTIANRLNDELVKINRQSVVSFNNVIINLNSAATPDIIIPGSAISFNTLIRNVIETYKKPIFIVSGEIVKDNNKLELQVRLKNKGKSPIIEDRDNNIDNMIRLAGELLYEQIDPLTLAGYYFYNGNLKNAIYMCKAHQVVPNNEVKKYLIWSSSLFGLKYYNEAL